MMDTNKMREQFELAMIIKIKAELEVLGEVMPDEDAEFFIRQSWLVRNGDSYFAVTIAYAWWAWQASREAVVVELPETHKPAPEDDERWHNVRNSTIGACRRAIEAQGLKVAP